MRDLQLFLTRPPPAAPAPAGRLWGVHGAGADPDARAGRLGWGGRVGPRDLPDWNAPDRPRRTRTTAGNGKLHTCRIGVMVSRPGQPTSPASGSSGGTQWRPRRGYPVPDARTHRPDCPQITRSRGPVSGWCRRSRNLGDQPERDSPAVSSLEQEGPVALPELLDVCVDPGPGRTREVPDELGKELVNGSELVGGE